MSYDSRPDTFEHIGEVQDRMHRVIHGLLRRAFAHDRSKLYPPELAVFDEYTPKLSQVAYGSSAYKLALEAMAPGLDHHYKVNRHHPEYHDDGIRGMSLLDLIEMLCDWEASTERHEDGNVHASIEQNQSRFGYSDDLKAILHNTIHELGNLGK